MKRSKKNSWRMNFLYKYFKIDSENQHTNNEHTHEELNKIVDWINREIYKKLVIILKKEMSSWNSEAFLKYTKLISEAKKIGIK
jgi:hypothetical protein